MSLVMVSMMSMVSRLWLGLSVSLSIVVSSVAVTSALVMMSMVSRLGLSFGVSLSVIVSPVSVSSSLVVMTVVARLGHGDADESEDEEKFHVSRSGLRTELW